MGDDVTVEQAQASWDAFCARVIDPRMRVIDGVRAPIVAHATAEPLRPAPAVPYPATVTETRIVSAQGLVAWRGNRYSVPPELAHATVTVSQRLGELVVDITTTGGITVARHALAPDGAGVMVRTTEHVTALDAHALAAFTTARPHRRKERIPVSAHASALLPARPADPTDVAHRDVVIDLARYARAAEGRNTLP